VRLLQNPAKISRLFFFGERFSPGGLSASRQFYRAGFSRLTACRFAKPPRALCIT
jgi:hypothetical protein